MAKREYNQKLNVYDAANERLAFIFENFERVYLSFSGGKDSGCLLNLVLDFMKKHGIKRKLGIQIMDNEANYEMSVQFMHDMIRQNRDMLDVYWCCLPITLPCTVSSFDVDWRCWGEAEKDKWVRPMPDDDYIVNLENHPFDFFQKNMHYDRFWDGFAEWYSQGKSCANMIGIRTSESLNRYRAIMNEEKETLKGRMWTKKNTAHTYNVYPIFDWTGEDVWVANAKFGWEYNKLYDIFYMAGVPLGKMRVASPFMSESKS